MKDNYLGSPSPALVTEMSAAMAADIPRPRLAGAAVSTLLMNKRTVSTWAFLGGSLFVLALLVSAFLVRPASPKPGKVELAAHKKIYAVGDVLSLTFRLSWSKYGTGSAKIYDDPVRNLILWIKPLGQGHDAYNSQYDTSAQNFNRGRSVSEAFKTRTFLPGHSLPIRIDALLRKGYRPGEILFDFGRYGVVPVRFAERYDMSGLFISADPDCFDSFEDYSNHVEIEVVPQLPAPKQ